MLNQEKIRELSEKIVRDIQHLDSTYDEVETIEKILSEFTIIESYSKVKHDLSMDNCAWTIRWDHKAWMKVPNSNEFTTDQHAWNQTVITKINQLSAQISKKSLTGGASIIKANPRFETILKDIPYYNEEEKSLAGRFEVMLFDEIPENEVYVHRKDWNQIRFMPERKKEFGGIKFFTNFSEDEQSEYNTMMIGCILIDNY